MAPGKVYQNGSNRGAVRAASLLLVSLLFIESNGRT